MIAYLKGTPYELTSSGCVLVTPCGVGYEVFLPTHTLSAVADKSAEVELFVCTVVREDALELYGFATWEERQTFLILTSISKVGSKTATAILSQFRPADLRRIVLEDDVMMLTAVSGIGKKTAQHIFLELKYKLDAGDTSAMAVLSASGGGQVLKDVVTGLVNLGYEEREAIGVAKEVLEEEPDLDVSAALRASLKAMARRKNV